MGEPAVEEENEPDLEELRHAIQQARTRLINLSRSDVLTPQAIAAEIGGTVLPLLGESVDFIDRLESHAEFVSDKFDQMEGIRSALQADDAEKLIAYIETVNGIVEASLAAAEPQSELAKKCAVLKNIGRELLERVDEIRVDDDDDEDEPDEAGEGDDDEDEEQPS